MEQGFVTWKVRSTPTLAEYLREGRERRHIQTKQIAEKINIRQVHLDLLEQGAFEQLPGDVYVRGFIRTYAAFLKLDPEYAVKLYRREKDIKKNVVMASRPPVGVLPKIRNPLLLMTPRMFTFAVIGLCMMVSSLYLWKQFANLAHAPELQIFEPGDNTIMKTASLAVNGKTDIGAVVSINGQQIFVDTSGNFNETVQLQQGVNAVTVVSRNKLGKETSLTKEVMAEIASVPAALVDSENEIAAQAHVVSGVTLEVKVDDSATWIYVETDGKFAYSGTMLQGSSQTFVGNKSVSLTTSDAPNTRVVYNGVAITSLSDQQGPLRDLEFTQDMQIKQHGRLVRKF